MAEGAPPDIAEAPSLASSRLGLLVLLLAGLGLAWWNRFILDDAFISFVYARNFANGAGLVWNGELVEGYTNFLWTLLLGLGMKAGVRPELGSLLLGLLSFGGSVVVFHRLCLLLFEDRPLAFWLGVALITNYSFCSFATGGLETSLQALLLLASFRMVLSAILAGRWPVEHTLAVGVLFALSVLNRLDSALCLAVLSAGMALALLRQEGPGGMIRKSAQMLAVFVPVVGAWFLWKLRFYGDLLPNTYYVKSNALSVDVLLRGASYLAMFVLSFLYVIIVPTLLVKRFDQLRSWRERPAGVRWGVGMAAAMCAVWWLYVVTSGGDFMEFRFLVPSIPLLLIGIGFLLHGASPRLRLSFITLLLLGNFFQFFATEYLGTRWELYRKGFSSVDALDVSFPARWHVIGRRLGEIFEHDRGVVIAVNPVGVITYQSDLTCVDLYGLNDRWVARHGSYDPKAPPGHRRQATLGYLMERGVHLLIGHPYEIALGKARHIRFDAETLGRLYLQVPEEVLPRLAGTSVLEIPIDAHRVLLAWYLTPSARVERAIDRFGLRRHPVVLGPAL